MVQGVYCPGSVLSRECMAQGVYCPGNVWSRECMVQGVYGPGSVLSRECMVQGDRLSSASSSMSHEGTKRMLCTGTVTQPHKGKISTKVQTNETIKQGQ